MAIQRQTRSYKLSRRGADGKSTELIEAGARVVAEPGVVYTLVDGDSGAILSSLRVRRAGDDLLVHGDDGLLVTVAGFFALQGSGTAFELPTVVADANGFELADGDSLITSETDVDDDGSSAPLMAQEGGAGMAAAAPPNAALGLLAVGIAGAGVGGGSGGGKPSGPQAIIADDGIGGAKISMHYDRNANGLVDAGEVILSDILSSRSPSKFGQFGIPLEKLQYDPSVGVLKLTGSGGTMLVDGRQLPVSGALEYKAYVTEAIFAQDSGVQVVLTPLTTMAACLFEDMLAQGLPQAADIRDANLAAMAKIARAFGLPGIDPVSLLRQAPGEWSAERSIAERQVNALCVALVALGAGSASADGSWQVAEQQVMTSIARYIDAHPGIDFADAGQLRAAIVVVLPAAADAATLLAQSLSALMNDIALFGGHGRPGSDAALSSLPSLAKTLASFHAALAEGRLAADDPALASALGSFDTALQTAAAKALPARAHAWVVVNDSGAFIDQNRDGQLDDSDRLGGQWVAANFSTGGNANLAAKAVSIVVTREPGSEVLASLSRIGADDSISVSYKAQVAGEFPQVPFGAAVMQPLLDSANAQGLKVDLLAVASAPGQSAVMQAGMEPYSGTVGSLRVESSGPRSGDAHAATWMFLALEGEIAGPVQVFGFGEGSYASLYELSAQGLAMHDMTVGAIGNGSLAMAQFYVDIGDDRLGKTAFSTASLLADAAGDESQSLIKFSASSGMLLADGDLHAHADGVGAMAELRMETDGGNIEVRGAMDATASGLHSKANIELSATRGALLVGDVLAETGGGMAGVYLSASSAVFVGQATALASAPCAPDLPVPDGQASVTVTSGTDGVYVLGAHALSTCISGQATVSLLGQAAAVVSFDAAASALAAHSSAALSIRTDAGIAQVGRIDVTSAAEQAKASMILSGAGSAYSPAIFVHGTTALYASGLQAESRMNVSSTIGAVRFGDDVVLAADGVASSTAFAAISSPAFAFKGDIQVGAYGLDASSGFHATAQAGDVKVDGSIVIASGAGTSVDLGDNTLDNLDVELRAQSGNVMVDGMVVVTSDADGSGALSGTGSRLAVTMDAHQGQLRIGGTLHAQLSGVDSALDMSVHAFGDVAVEGGIHFGVDTQVRRSLVHISSEAGNVSVGRNIVMVDGEFIDAAVLVAASATAMDARDVLGMLSSRTGSVHLQGNLMALANADGSKVRADAFAGTLSNRVDEAGVTVDNDVLVRAHGAGSSAMVVVGASDSSRDVWVKGALVADANGAFSEAEANVYHAMQGAGAVVIGGGLNSSAAGEGSRARINVTSDSGDIHIGGEVSVAATAAGAHAFLLTSAAQGSVSITGHISVLADSGVGSALGAVAVARVQLDALLSPASVDAVRAFDAASLELALERYGGSVTIGSASSAGMALLEFIGATAASVAIGFSASEGEAILALDVPDHDYGTTEDLVEAAVLEVSGFRAGTDKLCAGNLATDNVSFITVAGGDAPFRDRFHDAVLQMQNGTGTPAHYLMFAQEGDETCIAYDGDGNGVTGLIVLRGTMGFSTADVLLSLPAEPLQANWPQASAVAADLAPQSQTDTLVSYASLDVDAGTLQKKTPVINVDKALRISDHVMMLASGSSAEVIADILTNGTYPQAGDLTIDGDYLAQADGVGSSVAVTIAAHQGTLSVAGAWFTIASAMDAMASTTVTVNHLSDAAVPTPAVLVGGSLSVLASGDHARATQTLRADFGDIHLADLLAASGGYRGRAMLSVANEGGAIVAGDLLATTAGNESAAKLSLSTSHPDPASALAWNGAITTGMVEAIASAVQSSTDQGASVTISAKGGNLNVSSGIFALAEGRNSSASVVAEWSGLFEANGPNAMDNVQVGVPDDSGNASAANATASGEGGVASISVGASDGRISLRGSAVARATGTDSDAQLHLWTEKVIVSDPAQADRFGQIVVDQDVLSEASGLQSAAQLDVEVLQGVLFVQRDADANALADHASAGLALVAGHNGEDYRQMPTTPANPSLPLIGQGSMSIQRNLGANAYGYDSTAWVAATSVGGDLLLGGLLQALALGESSFAYALVQARNDGNVRMHGIDLQAEHFQALSQVIVYAEHGSALVDGDVSVASAGQTANAALHVHGAGGETTITGGVTLSCTGVQGKTTFWFSSAQIGGVTGAGDAAIGGAFAAQASGANSTLIVHIGSESGSAVSLGGGTDLVASGAGARVNLDIVGASTATSPTAVDIAGDLRLLAFGEGSVISASARSTAGGVHIGGDVDVTAAGLRSEIRDDDAVDQRMAIRATAGDLLIDGTVTLQASGDHASVKAVLGAPDGLLQIGSDLDALASGFEGELHLLSSGSNIVVHGDVNAMAVGAGSTLEFDWGLLNGSTPTGTLIDGRIAMVADSGSGDVAGSTLQASIAMLHLQLVAAELQGVAGGLLVDARHSGDQATVDLNLSNFGGHAELGVAGSAGEASLNFVGALASDIKIGFTGMMGQATIGVHLDAANDWTLTAEEILEQITVVSGFRADGAHDQLDFAALNLGSNTANEYDNLQELVNAADQSLDGVAQVFAGRFNGDTYIAFDIDGEGFTGMLELDGVNQQQASYITSTGAPA